MPVFAAMVIAGATLLVAFVAYRHQKRLDRENDILRERRARYDAYIIRRCSFYSAIRKAERGSDDTDLREYFPERYSCTLFSPDEIHREITSHANAANLAAEAVRTLRSSRQDQSASLADDFQSYQRKIKTEEDAFDKLLHAMRRDVASNSRLAFTASGYTRENETRVSGKIDRDGMTKAVESDPQ